MEVIIDLGSKKKIESISINYLVIQIHGYLNQNLLNLNFQKIGNDYYLSHLLVSEDTKSGNEYRSIAEHHKSIWIKGKIY